MDDNCRSAPWMLDYPGCFPTTDFATLDPWLFTLVPSGSRSEPFSSDSYAGTAMQSVPIEEHTACDGRSRVKRVALRPWSKVNSKGLTPLTNSESKTAVLRLPVIWTGSCSVPTLSIKRYRLERALVAVFDKRLQNLPRRGKMFIAPRFNVGLQRNNTSTLKGLYKDLWHPFRVHKRWQPETPR